MKLLYLVHRLPYPPNKGDKISSFNILRHFAKSHEIYLGTFIDNPDDWQYVETVRQYCRDVRVFGLRPRLGRISSLRGLLTREALSNVYYRNAELQRWTNDTLRNVTPDAVLMYSGCMGQYIDSKLASGTRTVFEPEDIDSEKWAAYAATKPWPLSWIYEREARLLRAFECRMAQTFDATVFISAAEATLFKSLCPAAAPRVTFRTQGVDIDYFDPARAYENPFAAADRPLVFVGAMDYWPNIQAVTWYSKEVFPHVLAQHAQAKFFIVGSSPTPEVRRLSSAPGIVVTGAVADVRPYLQHAWAACLPLQIAQGIQNKALEAMAMAKRVVASPQALSGISASGSYAPTSCTTPAEWVSSSIEALSAGRVHDDQAREFVKLHYGWETNLQRFERTVFG